MFIHANGGRLIHSLFELPVKRRETAVEPHHQRFASPLGLLKQLLALLQRLRQRFIDVNVHAAVQQLAYHRKMAGGAAVNKDRIALFGQLSRREKQAIR